MATSVDDLLRQAEREAWRLIQSGPQLGSAVIDGRMPTRQERQDAITDRSRAATWHTGRAEALLSGWRALGLNGARLLDGVPGATNDDPVRHGLRVLAGTQRDGDVDPHLRRLTECVGAAADLLNGQAVPGADREEDGRALRDRCVRLIESVATTTQVHLERSSRRLRDSSGREAKALSVLTGQLWSERAEPGRGSVFADVAAARPGERTLDGAMHVWRGVAMAGTEAHAAAASTDRLRVIVADLAVITRGAAEVLDHAENVNPTRVGGQARERGLAASQAWMEVLADWPRWLRSGAGVDAAQVGATSQIRAALTPLIHGADESPGGHVQYPAGRDAHATARRMLVEVEMVGERVAAAVRTLARSEGFTAPARRLVEDVARDPTRAEDITGVDPVHERYRTAAVRGRWTTVAGDASCVRLVQSRVENAVTSSKTARHFADGTVNAALSFPSPGVARVSRLAPAPERAPQRRGLAERGVSGPER